MKPLCLILACSLSVLAISSALAANPSSERFATISTRNAFRLGPPKSLAIEVPPEPNRSLVSLQGITTILGRTLALLTIEPASKSAKSFETSCVLGQGERRFEVVVLEVNAETATVRLNNLGAEQLLVLKR